MADQIRHRSVTVPANTAIATPYIQDISFPNGEVERIDILVPPGNAGLLGFAIATAHQPIIPFDAGEFLLAEGERLSFPLENFPDSGNWQIHAYNLDINPHTFYVTLLLKIVRQQIVVVGGPAPYAAPAVGSNVGTGIITVPSEPGDGGSGTDPLPDTDPEPFPDPDTDPDIEPEPEPEPEPFPEDPVFTPDPIWDPEPTPDPGPVFDPDPTPVPPPPAPTPPAPQYTYFVMQGWQPDGDVHEYHFWLNGPRAGQLILLSKLGNYGKAPTGLSVALKAIGWTYAQEVFAGRNVRFQRITGSGTGAS